MEKAKQSTERAAGGKNIFKLENFPTPRVPLYEHNIRESQLSKMPNIWKVVKFYTEAELLDIRRSNVSLRWSGSKMIPDNVNFPAFLSPPVSALRAYFYIVNTVKMLLAQLKQIVLRNLMEVVLCNAMQFPYFPFASFPSSSLLKVCNWNLRFFPSHFYAALFILARMTTVHVIFTRHIYNENFLLCSAPAVD